MKKIHNSIKHSNYHLYPELVFKISDEKLPTPVKCRTCAESICNFPRLCYEQIYKHLSHSTGCNDLWLMLQMGNRNTLWYISNLKTDPYMAYYFRGFSNVKLQSCTLGSNLGSKSWWFNRRVMILFLFFFIILVTYARIEDHRSFYHLM